MNTPSFSSVNTMIERWNEKGITHVAIIDDAFDPPHVTDYSRVECEDFIAAILDDEMALEEADQLGCDISSLENLDEALAILWTHREKLSALRGYCSPLFRPLEDKLEQLAPLRHSLEEQERTVECIGINGSISNTAVGLIFIDYRLGTGEGSIEHAKYIASLIAKMYVDSPSKPLMILMSSTHVTDDMINSFRKETGLIPGMFYFLPKDIFEDKDKLFFKLNHFLAAVPNAAQIQSLLDNMKLGLDRISSKFVQDIKELSFTDYTYIQALSLQDDGHPLGDYMLWLFTSYLGHLLSNDEQIRVQRKRLDKITFNEWPSGQTPPSLWLATIYGSTLASDEDNDLIHPRTPADDNQGLPFLFLGDLFVKDASSPLWMVLNAQCDLAFTPDSRQRSPQSDRSVFMIPGEMQLLSQSLSMYEANKPRTELFRWKDTAYRIIWDTKHVRSRELGQVLSWCETDGYARVARLRLPFALAVQQAFGNDMTRMGMPVAPPLYRPIRMELLCSGGDGKGILLNTSDRCASFLTRFGGQYVEKCSLDEDFLYSVPDKIGSAMSLLRERIDYLRQRDAKPESITKIQSLIEMLLPYANAGAIYQALRVPFDLPNSSISEKNIQLPSHPFCITRNQQVIGRSYRFDQPLVLNVIDIEETGGAS